MNNLNELSCFYSVCIWETLAQWGRSEFLWWGELKLKFQERRLHQLWEEHPSGQGKEETLSHLAGCEAKGLTLLTVEIGCDPRKYRSPEGLDQQLHTFPSFRSQSAESRDLHSWGSVRREDHHIPDKKNDKGDSSCLKLSDRNQKDRQRQHTPQMEGEMKQAHMESGSWLGHPHRHHHFHRLHTKEESKMAHTCVEWGCWCGCRIPHNRVHKLERPDQKKKLWRVRVISYMWKVKRIRFNSPDKWRSQRDMRHRQGIAQNKLGEGT